MENTNKEQTQEEFNKIMNDYYDSLKDTQNEINERNAVLLDEIKKEKGDTFFNALHEFMIDSEVSGLFTIVKSPKGEKQYEGKTLKSSWVDQRSVGWEGDSWEGTITIQINKNKYLEMPFEI